MREIVHIQLGKAGNAIGTKFWEAICEEHGINPRGVYTGDARQQLEKINVFFHQSRSNRMRTVLAHIIPGKHYIPRAVSIDSDYQSIEGVRNSVFGNIFRPENLLSGRDSCHSNWAKGFYTEGRLLTGSILERARREAERCDCLQGFQLVHSIGGGTGSGLGSFVLEKLCEEYPTRFLRSYTVIPSLHIMYDITQTYNAVISLHQLTEMNIETYCMDNKALEYICENSLGMAKAGYENMNYLISTAMAGVTTVDRFPGRLNEGLQRSSTNTIPFPRLHYLTTGFTPILDEGSRTEERISVQKLSDELLKPDNIFIHPKTDGKCMTASYLYRGDLSEAEVKTYTYHFFRKNSRKYVDWLPDNVKTEVCPVPLRKLERAAVVIGNTTAISALFKRLLELFDSIHEKRRYIHWFTDEGVCDDELDAARTSLHELWQDYKKCEGAAYDDVWHDVNEDWGGQL